MGQVSIRYISFDLQTSNSFQVGERERKKETKKDDVNGCCFFVCFFVLGRLQGLHGKTGERMKTRRQHKRLAMFSCDS